MIRKKELLERIESLEKELDAIEEYLGVSVEEKMVIKAPMGFKT